ncbi:MAG: hypothetical protein OEN56_03165 [Gemmatimonadota bacterium]|nr:hypothetical protein [Gemmatimonadota bacterium]
MKSTAPIARMTVRTVLAVLLASTPQTIAAQATGLAPGDEVRVRWEYAGRPSYAFGYTRSAIARVVDVSPSHLTLRRGNRDFVVPVRGVQTLERRVGTRPASAPRMVIGSGLGFLGGVAIGVLRAEADPTIESSGDFGLSMGVLIGAPVGALIAYVTSRERGIYEPVGVAGIFSGMRIDPSGRVGLSVRIGGG